MHRPTICGLSVAGILLASLMATGQAVAAPEFLKNGAPIATVAFKESSGFGKLVSSSTTLEWKAATGEGILEKPNKVTKFVLRFTGDKIGLCEVKSPGAPAGEIVTKEIKGALGYINEATKTVGLLIEPAASPLFEVETSGCHAAFTVTGSAIGQVTPINTKTLNLEVAFNASGTKQEFKKFAGEAIEHFLSLGEGEGGFSCKEKVTTVEEVEVKA